MRAKCGLPAAFLGVLAAAFVGIGGCSKPAETARPVKFYQSPMHPWIVSDKPGNCTICGMKLVPVYEGDAPAKTGGIILPKDSVTALGVATVPVRRLPVTKTLRFSGILEDDENLHRVIAAFYDGRIEQIFVEHVGQYVEKGRPLAAIYSPELLYVVREYQNAMRGRNETVARNSAQRLIQYGLSPEQLADLAKLPENVYTINLLAPISGTILIKKAYRGQYIKTGEPLFEMGDLARLWFHAEVYERDLASLRLGQNAVVTSPTAPGREFKGTVTFIDPNFDPQTRSTRVRIEVDNPPAAEDGHGRRLLPHRAYAEAEIEANLGEALVVPRSAVLRDGRRSVAYVEKASGGYDLRSVKVGRVGDEGVEILDGLQEGERVVTNGNLMIDAEAQLRGNPSGPLSGGTAKLDAPVGEHFLHRLAEVAEALAADDAVRAAQTGQELRKLAAALAPTGVEPVDAAIRKLQALSQNPAGSDLKALRRSFLPWSVDGAALALAVERAGQPAGVHVFECPMTGESFPGAPEKASWVQAGADIRNPYFGSEMIDCGREVLP